jgi:hypothetical protein
MRPRPPLAGPHARNRGLRDPGPPTVRPRHSGLAPVLAHCQRQHSPRERQPHGVAVLFGVAAVHRNRVRRQATRTGIGIPRPQARRRLGVRLDGLLDERLSTPTRHHVFSLCLPYLLVAGGDLEADYPGRFVACLAAGGSGGSNAAIMASAMKAPYRSAGQPRLRTSSS